MSLHLPSFHERHVKPNQVLWEDAERVVYRALRDEPAGDQRTVLVVLPATENPSSASLDRLAHEYGLKDHLDAPWAVRPLALLREHGRTMLVLDDPGGDLLHRFTGSPMALPTFLRLAEALAAALRGMHERGLIHRDIHPANILVSDSMTQVRLTGFGVASRLLRERQAPTPPELIAGTLPYMAPEQTGRMNRSMDARSDLYSLGVTLYQMLTGALPFSATDPLEWVHCHIARQPVAPAERVVLPKPLSAIAMKLLAKNAEDRYQTAGGVEHDLRKCRAEWETRGAIEEFSLAAHDAPDQFCIHEKLYGRSREVAALLGAFEQVIATGGPQLVLVSGYSGVGKSSVVNELHKVLVPPRGLFAFGKFDQYKRGIPYATVAQAFQRLVLQLLGKSEAVLQAWREALREALGPNGLLISGLIPELELIIGKQPPVSELRPQDAQRRFKTVLRRFIAVFARPEHPLALFLDDLQWLDDATLDLLADILVEGDINHLLLIGAYRDNEVDEAHPLMRQLDVIRKTAAIVRDIVLAPLSSGDLGQLVADSLRCEPQRARPLVQLLQEKTGGNPFFASQFLYALAEEGLLSFDHADGRWSWDLGRIHAKHFTENVVDLMTVKLERLPADTLAVLRQLACVGFEADFAFLATICQTSQEGLHTRLWEAVRSRLVLRSENLYTFQHDRIQEAAYSLVPEEARAAEHLRIGRLLLAHVPPDERDEILFDIVNQLNRGVEIITSEDERVQLAELNLAAGNRAKASAAYASALEHFIAGRLLLTMECWERRSDLVFQLELHRAECEFLTGEPAAAAERVEMLRSRATGTVALAMATCLGIDIYLAAGQVDRAVAVGRDYLRHLAIDWPPHPTEEQVRSEYQRVWTQLGSRAIEDVMDCPLMSDPASIGAIDVLTKVLPAAAHIDANLLAWVVCRAVSISIEHGNNDGSCFCYVWFSAIAGLRFGDYDRGLRFAQLGYDLVEKRGLKRFQARTYNTFSSICMPWVKPLPACRDEVRRAFEIANQVGDLSYAVFCLMSLPPKLLGAGVLLSEVERETVAAVEFARKSNFGYFAPVAQLKLGLIRTLRGSTAKFGYLDHPELDEIVFERDLGHQSAMACCYYWIAKMQARFSAGDFVSAVEARAKARALLWASPTFEVADYEFYGALSLAASWESAESDPGREHFDALEAHGKRLAIWAEHCPENFEDRAALIGAEIARLERRELDAERLYEQAIRSARANRHVHIEALAYETVARFHAARGLENFAEVFLARARDGYLRWGADGKVRQLEARYPRLATAKAFGEARAPTTPDHQLDVAVVVKASQALSSEMLLPSLIERLMAIALQSGGADRGLLIRPDPTGYRIEAEARTDGDGVVLDFSGSVGPSVPETLIRYVMRTQESVILDDARQQHLFSEDPYLLLRRPRSVLCLPLVRQAALSGLLYLENTLAPGVFTAGRARLLELLASQAAISLENAALYADLELQVGLLQRLPVSAWTLKPDGTPEFVNQVWLEFAGQDLDFVRSGPEAWTAAIHPEDRETAARTFREGVKSGQNFTMEYRSLRSRDGVYRSVLSQAVVLRDPEGHILKFVGTTTDIDDQKRTEEALRQAHADLARVNRVTTMGELAASVVHEVSGPVTGVLTNTAVCLRRLERDKPDIEEVRGVITRMARDAQRAADIIDRIRAQFRKSSPLQEPLDLSAMILEVIALLRSEAVQCDIAVRTDLPPDLPAVVGDRVQLQQVVMNLFVNSIEAMKDVQGTRVVAVQARRVDGYVLVSVRDTGTGLPPHVATRMFEPLFTTKPHGTGMGLRISRSIIESHDGRLWAAANDGPGATLTFSLPCKG